MLKEILGVTDEPQARRRWFHDEYFDLFVWQANAGETNAGELVAFQLCYGRDASEQALVWSKESGFFHDGPVRSGDPGSGTDPMLARLDIAAGELPADIRTTLVELVREYARKKPAVTSRRKRFRRADWQKLEPQAR